MRLVLSASCGMMMAGPVGAVVGAVAPLLWSRWRNRPEPDPPVRLVMLLLLVGLRSGLSVLASLVEASRALPRYAVLRSVARVARVSGLMESLAHADEGLRPLLAQLARAQRSGASLSGAVRRMLDTELAAEKARRIARARSLPVKLMIPVTLLMLPGLVLLLYGPSLLSMFSELTGALG